MTDGVLREAIERHWAALEAEQAGGDRRLRVSDLPVTTDRGPLAVGVDHDGHRHLLVPIHSHQKVRTGLDGPVLRLHKRPLEDAEVYQTYADLGCLRDDFNDLFTELCADVVAVTESMSETPVKALYHVLDRWRALFRTGGRILRPEQLAGLFGELLLLRRLLEADPSAHRLWRAPHGHRHDFTAATIAIEVKSTAIGTGRRPRIHGLDQLEPPAGGVLYLAWFRLQRTTAQGIGTGFIESIERALRLCDDESALLELLASAGYHSSDSHHYRDVRFMATDEAWYRVDADFPGLTSHTLTAAGVPVTVQDVEYTIDLSGKRPVPLTHDTVSNVIDTMTQESV
ncbi:PD-(D/E)XK motif protein [Kitasatospora acidiphila]|uniref:PD-(D/E)XK motif protein n=1 Tax=Kitasatospora acidiphila TaxID=2567942 RepID=A0A540WBF2_9ACTN|nr:PD-(D/E)XK motif protein [Kitasatospora acidiphila]TQF06336.1 PD-(D/E)XK motif protein [Kitasatospora acidiphila]